MKIGIYGIKNIETERMYIGSSIDIDSRILSHISQLNNGNHSNSELQDDFNLSGIGNFCFKHLLYCRKDELIEHENRIIQSIKNHYNKRSGDIGRHERPPKKIQLGFRLPEHLLSQLEIEAKRRNRSVTNLVETILKKELDLL